jgi:CRISPR-associated protein Csd2
MDLHALPGQFFGLEVRRLREDTRWSQAELAERTGFSDADADVIKRILPKLFENDASSARPDGSMEVLKVLWWKHNSRGGQYSSAKVHRSPRISPDGSYALDPLEDLTPEEIDGF